MLAKRALVIAAVLATTSAPAYTPGFMVPAGMFGKTSCNTTWNPADKGSGITLSASKLGFTVPNSGNYLVRSTTAKTSGKWYFEITVANTTGTTNIPLSLGIAQSSTLLGTWVGQDTNSWGYPSQFVTPSFYNNGFTLCPPGAGGSASPGSSGANSGSTTGGCTVSVTAFGASPGDVIGIAVDLNSNYFYASLNGTWQYSANPATGTYPIPIYAGTYFAAASSDSLGGSWGSGSSATANFGATAFTYTPPAGYSPWC